MDLKWPIFSHSWSTEVVMVAHSHTQTFIQKSDFYHSPNNRENPVTTSLFWRIWFHLWYLVFAASPLRPCLWPLNHEVQLKVTGGWGGVVLSSGSSNILFIQNTKGSGCFNQMRSDSLCSFSVILKILSEASQSHFSITSSLELHH